MANNDEFGPGTVVMKGTGGFRRDEEFGPGTVVMKGTGGFRRDEELVAV